MIVAVLGLLLAPLRIGVFIIIPGLNVMGEQPLVLALSVVREYLPGRLGRTSAFVTD